MEVYRTQDGQVSKYIHDDGSETAIKTVSSCGNIVNKITGKVELTEVDRNKYSAFVSSSVGCPVGCKFCYLTVKKYPYYKLTPDQIVENFKEALTEEVEHNPSIRSKYLKISWMGMGDPFLIDPYDLRQMTEYMFGWAIGAQNLATGIDGVDIATVMPRENYGWAHQFALLNDYLKGRYRRNNSVEGRSIVRVFYSLHSIANRVNIIPTNRKGGPVIDLQELSRARSLYGIDVILHQLLLKGINDNDGAIEDTANILNNLINGAELRVLRFNKCSGSTYEETDKFDALVRKYAEVLPKIKYQISPGSEVKAACGQFLCKDIKGTK